MDAGQPFDRLGSYSRIVLESSFVAFSWRRYRIFSNDFVYVLREGVADEHLYGPISQS